jgi:hypothetical protein
VPTYFNPEAFSLNLFPVLVGEQEGRNDTGSIKHWTIYVNG